MENLVVRRLAVSSIAWLDGLASPAQYSWNQETEQYADANGPKKKEETVVHHEQWKSMRERQRDWSPYPAEDCEPLRLNIHA
jgi:hypothetical protein